MTVATKRKTYPGADAIARIDLRLDQLAHRDAVAPSRPTLRIDQENLPAANMLSSIRAEEIDRVIAEINACCRVLDRELTHSSLSTSQQQVQRNELHSFRPRQSIEALEAEVGARAARLAGTAHKPHQGRKR